MAYSRPATRNRLRELQINCPTMRTPAKCVPATSVIQDYTLNEQKALNKKLEHCSRPNELSFKATYGGLVIYYQTGLYEAFRLVLPTWADLQDDKNKSVTVKHKKDKNGHVSESTYSVNSIKPRRKLYVINMYHTTSSSLINGNSLELFTQHDLDEILALIHQFNLSIANINKNCRTALEAYQKIRTDCGQITKGPWSKKQETKTQASNPPGAKLEALKSAAHTINTTPYAGAAGTVLQTHSRTETPVASDNQSICMPTMRQNVLKRIQNVPTPSMSQHPDPSKAVHVYDNLPAEEIKDTSTLNEDLIELDGANRDDHIVIYDNCNVCGNTCTDGTVYCDIGLHWIHYKCAGLSNEQILHLEDPMNQKKYDCPPCSQLQTYDSHKPTQPQNLPDQEVSIILLPDHPSTNDRDKSANSSYTSQTCTTNKKSQPAPNIIQDTCESNTHQSSRNVTNSVKSHAPIPQTENESNKQLKAELTEREKTLRVKERNLNTREKLLRDQEAELTDLSQKLSCSRSYIHQLEDEMKAVKDENCFLMLCLSALSGTASNPTPSPSQPTQSIDDMRHNENNNFYKLENQILQMRLEQSKKHSQLQDYLMKQSHVMLLIFQKLENQTTTRPHKPNQPEKHNGTSRRNRSSKEQKNTSSATNINYNTDLFVKETTTDNGTDTRCNEAFTGVTPSDDLDTKQASVYLTEYIDQSSYETSAHNMHLRENIACREALQYTREDPVRASQQVTDDGRANRNVTSQHSPRVITHQADSQPKPNSTLERKTDWSTGGDKENTATQSFLEVSPAQKNPT